MRKTFAGVQLHQDSSPPANICSQELSNPALFFSPASGALVGADTLGYSFVSIILEKATRRASIF